MEGGGATSIVKTELFFLIQACRSLYRNSFTQGTQGNGSLRIDAHRILITPSKKSFRDLKESDLVSVDLDGRILDGSRKPSIETPFHLAVYRTRRDINVVLHTHPLNVIKYSFRGKHLVLSGTEGVFSTFPVVRYLRPGSAELAREVSENILRHDAVILSRHGLVTGGKNVAQAYFLTKIIEMNAEIQNRMRYRQKSI